jgi:hypothetical protein
MFKVLMVLSRYCSYPVLNQLPLHSALLRTTSVNMLQHNARSAATVVLQYCDCYYYAILRRLSPFDSVATSSTVRASLLLLSEHDSTATTTTTLYYAA